MYEKLTVDQEQYLKEYYDKYLSIGRSTEPLNRSKCSDVIDELYKHLSPPLSPPIKIFLPSPLSCFLGALLVGDLRDQLWDQLRDQLWDQLGNQLRNQLWGQLWGQLWDQLGDQLGGQLRRNLAGFMYGNHNISWQTFYDFPRKIYPSFYRSEWQNSILDLWMSEVENLHWWLPYGNIVFISERPSFLSLNSNGQLHNENRIAMEYRDGYGIYALNGVRVTREIIELNGENFKPALFTKEPNVEVRREILRKIGPEVLKQKMGGKTIDEKIVIFPEDIPSSSPSPSWAKGSKRMPPSSKYSLILLNLGGDTGEWPYLEMWNPSEECFHMEAVPKTCRTVKEALNFRNLGEHTHLLPIS